MNKAIYSLDKTVNSLNHYNSQTQPPALHPTNFTHVPTTPIKNNLFVAN